MIIVLFLILALLLGLNVALAYALTKALNAQYDEMQLNEEIISDVEKALKSLDRTYHELSQAANADVLYDDPTVRRVVASMKSCRTSVMNVAQRLSSSIETTTEENPDGIDKKKAR